jgi:CPA1 family monovalent cation:H+ antiporter
MRIWQILAAMAAGLLVGVFEPGRFTYAFGHATLYIFLPPLLFEAAWNLNYRVMRRTGWAIAALAGPGVAITALLVTGALLLVRMPLGIALLLGAILSATDPIAVVAVFRRLRVPRSLATIVECESLFNDAVAVVLYRAVLLVLAAAATGKEILTASAVAVVGSVAGVLVGIAIASLAAALLRNRNNVSLQIVATIAAAYGAYFLADSFGASGIFATISCGIALRLYERAWIAVTIAGDVERFWDLGAVLANALVFFLAGAAFDLVPAGRSPEYAGAAFAGVAIARIALGTLLFPAGYPRRWLDVIRSAGMRGALPLALALALPAAIPLRADVVATAFCVVVATIVVSAFTVPHAVRRVQLRGPRRKMTSHPIG